MNCSFRTSNNYFIELKRKKSLWKVHPNINYVIEDVQFEKNTKLNNEESIIILMVMSEVILLW